MNNYKIKSNYKLLRDASSVRFHAENDDYFGTAATTLRLLKDSLSELIAKSPAEDRDLINKTFNNLENDLMILQNNYLIVAKKKASQKSPKGRLNSQ